jgi:hypothetical protein
MIHIYCDGGLGNRLLMMFSGLHFAKQANKEFIIHWPSNNWCGCNFNDLFDNKYNVTNFNLKFLDTNILPVDCALLIHEVQIPFRSKRIQINSLATYEGMITSFITEKDILYYGNSLHNSLKPDVVSNVVKELKINEDILKRVSQFKLEDTYGVHIRGTDFPEAPLITIPQMEQEIAEHPERKFFICSDQKDIEMSFLSKFGNTFIMEKKSYVEPLDKNQGWHGRITDDLNRSFNFNVSRSKNSVIEAFCDMLLLSKTKLYKTSNSSFLKCAYALSKGKIV